MKKNRIFLSLPMSSLVILNLTGSMSSRTDNQKRIRFRYKEGSRSQ